MEVYQAADLSAERNDRSRCRWHRPKSGMQSPHRCGAERWGLEIISFHHGFQPELRFHARRRGVYGRPGAWMVRLRRRSVTGRFRWRPGSGRSSTDPVSRASCNTIMCILPYSRRRHRITLFVTAFESVGGPPQEGVRCDVKVGPGRSRRDRHLEGRRADRRGGRIVCEGLAHHFVSPRTRESTHALSTTWISSSSPASSSRSSGPAGAGSRPCSRRSPG